MFDDDFLGQVYLEYLRAYDFGYPANLVTIAGNLPDLPQNVLLERIKECADFTITSTADGIYEHDSLREKMRESAHEKSRAIPSENPRKFEVKKSSHLKKWKCREKQNKKGSGLEGCEKCKEV